MGQTQTILTMKTVISSLLVLYGASAANQRLLQQAPEFVAQPAAPVTPAVVPAATTAAPVMPAIPNIVLPGLGAPSMILECVTPYNMPSTCAGTLKEFTNPVNEFKIECGIGCVRTNQL